jgi:hypothetical protein
MRFLLFRPYPKSIPFEGTSSGRPKNFEEGIMLEIAKEGNIIDYYD